MNDWIRRICCELIRLLIWNLSFSNVYVLKYWFKNYHDELQWKSIFNIALSLQETQYSVVEDFLIFYIYRYAWSTNKTCIRDFPQKMCLRFHGKYWKNASKVLLVNSDSVEILVCKADLFPSDLWRSKWLSNFIIVNLGRNDHAVLSW